MITKESKNILIADDSEFFRVKLTDILSEAGHKTTFVDDGRGVIEGLKEGSEECDLLMLDLQMPGVDGFAVMEWINESGLAGKFPVLAVTGVYETANILDRLKELGTAGFMTKAFSPEQVVHRVNRLLFPEKVEREVPRLPISIPVDFTLGDASYTGYLLNLSAGGIFLHAKQELKPDTALNLKFSLPGYDSIIVVNGTVKWCTYVTGEENLFGGVGIAFLNLSSENKEVLRQFVHREMTKLKLQE